MSCKPPLCALTRSRIFLVFQVDAPNLTYPPVPFAPPLPPHSPPKGGEAPSKLTLKLARLEVGYSPPFWISLQHFLRPMENVKWASPLLGTATMRAKHPSMYRAIDKAMREVWHLPQMKFMTVFIELSELMGIPSPRHATDIQLHGGLYFRLFSEKEPLSELLMEASLPPLTVRKQANLVPNPDSDPDPDLNYDPNLNPDPNRTT